MKGKLSGLEVHKDTGISSAFATSDGSPGTTTAHHTSASYHMLSSLEAGTCPAQHCIFSTEPRVDGMSGSQGQVNKSSFSSATEQLCGGLQPSPSIKRGSARVLRRWCGQ